MAVTFVAILSSSYLGRLIDRLGERRVLQGINIGYVVALGGYALAHDVYLACVFYVIYSFIAMFSTIGASTYLRKIAVPEEVAPSLAMGVTILHVTAVVVPVAAGFILNYVGYQIPFFIACGAALVTVAVTRGWTRRAAHGGPGGAGRGQARRRRRRARQPGRPRRTAGATPNRSRPGAPAGASRSLLQGGLQVGEELSSSFTLSGAFRDESYGSASNATTM